MQTIEENNLDVSIVMPCLNEVNTVGLCVDEAKAFLERNHLYGEILVVDNGSFDDSVSVAKNHGAKVIHEKRKGYGRAVRTGMAHSRGKVIIMGDCDMTYDFNNLEKIYQPLSQGTCHIIIGNRYAGSMEKGAMSWSHRWGVRFLSWLGRILFHTDVYDFHCGLRGILKDVADQFSFYTDGMEFATEMIAQAAGKKLHIMQVPVVLRKCQYQRRSKLRTLRDGWRHVRYMIGYKQWRKEQ